MKSWIEVSADRLTANFGAVQAAAPGFEILAVIKADAYGHGAEQCALVLAGAGAHWFGVTDLEEGQRVQGVLRDSGWAAEDRRVVVLSGFEPEDAATIVRSGLTPVVWTPQHVFALQQAASEVGERVAVHVEVDTGMARQGVTPGPALQSLLDSLRVSPRVRPEGLFSHLVASEVAHSEETRKQEQRFSEAKSQIREAEFLPEWVHFGNSAAVEEGSTLVWLGNLAATGMMELMVRPGLALYGYVLPLEGDAGPGGSLRSSLQPVATWKTHVIGVREIEAGETVGYGATFVAERVMRLALLPIGYADGFRREASSGIGDGWVMIAGSRAPVVGRVSMNLTVVDVTEHGLVQVGDDVVLLGEGVSAEDHAHWCGTIPYEILCGMRGHRRLV